MDAMELRQVTEFISKYQITQLNPETILLSSRDTSVLVKSHLVDEGSLDQTVQLMDQHLSFDPQYVCPLLHFEICDNQQGLNYIRAVYQLDRVTLRDQIQARKRKLQPFSQSQIWILMSSLVNSLIYLQQKNVAYGILSTRKIFVEDKIRLINPSAFDPYSMSVSHISLHSPEIRQNREDIDFFMSDVYLLGLCILQSVTLTQITNEITRQQIQSLIQVAQNNFSQELIHVLNYMLQQNCQERPTFDNIKEYIETQIQITEAKVIPAVILSKDQQDLVYLYPSIEDNFESQKIDILQISNHLRSQQNQYEMARQRFLFWSPEKDIKEVKTKCSQSNSSVQYVQRQSKNMKKSQLCIQQFHISSKENTNHQTISKIKNRAIQIKNRNSETVKTVDSIQLPLNPSFNSKINQYSEYNSSTSPQLWSMIEEKTKRAHQFFEQESKISIK